MAIAATSGVTPSTATSATDTSTTGSTNAAAGPDSLDYDSFLQLLIAQMKNQDPTKPTDPSQFISQLASFSGVEQAIKTNNKLDTLMTSLALTQAEGFIGRTVASADGSVQGTVAGIRVISGGAVAILDNGQELPLAAGVTVT
jgi:flagellar basal-body rod modification protein FlgD